MAVTEIGHLASREVDELYRRHGGEVYRYAYAVLGNHADAEDITQTTFLNAYRSLEQGIRPRKPSNWLLTIASNAIKQRFRQDQARPRQVELDDRLADKETDDDGPSVGELLTALSKIPPQQRQAIVLREFEGRSYAEIAGILGVTTSALETLLFRARKSLAEELEHQLTCTDAQLAISKAIDGRLGRKERRRLRDHIGECPDCASFARMQKGHRTALRGLLFLPIPVSLSVLKGLQSPGAASAATLHATAPTSAGVAASTGGISVSTTAGGGLLVTGATIKVAAVVAAVSVAGGVTALEVSKIESDLPSANTKASTHQGKRLGQTAPRGVLVPANGVARGKASAPGQRRRALGRATRGKSATSHGHALGRSPTHLAVAAARGTGAHGSAASAGAASSGAGEREPGTSAGASPSPTTQTNIAAGQSTPTKLKAKAKATAKHAKPKAATHTTPTRRRTPPAAPVAEPTTSGHNGQGAGNGATTGSVNGSGGANGNGKGK